MYAFHNCSLYYPVMGQLGRIGTTNNQRELSIFNENTYILDKNIIDDKWNVALEFNEPGGAYDNAFFGEKTDASDEQDSYDVPKGPAGIAPLIRAWFNTDFPDPYDELWKDYKYYPDSYKVWNLTVQWIPSDYSSPTSMTISWDANTLNDYGSMILHDAINNVNVADMNSVSSYTFTCSALELQKFQIICSTNQPPYIPSDPEPDDSSMDIDIEANLSWTGGDPDSEDTVTYDVYFGTTSSPPKVISNQSTTLYYTDKLENNTIYYWKIVAYDNHGAMTSGPIWSFTTKKSKELNVEETTIKKVALNSNFRPQKVLGFIGV
jgi:hypothetical protein